MKAKPKGLKYRNLHARGGSIVYERIVGEGEQRKRIKRSLGVDDWNEAAATRDALEAKLGVGSPFLRLECPTFAEGAEAYLDGLSHLAATTRDDRAMMLGAERPLVQRFGAMRLDAIRRVHLLDWWGEWIERGDRSPKTGRNYLDALAGVFVWAMEREHLDENPVEGVRAVLRRRSLTQQGRLEAEPGRHVHPFEAAELARFLEKSSASGGAEHVVNMLCLDAGVRLGEALGLRWQDVRWGRDASDPSRVLTIQQTRARGEHVGPTKSGRGREVALSRRLRAVLLEWRLASGRPGDDVRVVGIDMHSYRKHHFRPICKAAELGHRRPKDLRDTFASQLLTCGVSLGYVSMQLGHADVAVTARHYARWTGGATYREPMPLAPGEVPADLLARLPVAESSHQSPTTTQQGA